MKKNSLAIVIIIMLILIVAIFISYKLINNRQVVPAGYINPIEDPIAVTVPPAIINMPKPIELEFMAEKEKENFSLSTSSVDNIQVLERDENGNITSYKIIKKDSDILKEY